MKKFCVVLYFIIKKIYLFVTFYMFTLYLQIMDGDIIGLWGAVVPPNFLNKKNTSVCVCIYIYI